MTQETLSEWFNTHTQILMLEDCKEHQTNVFENPAFGREERVRATSIIVKCDDRLRELRG